MVLPGKQNLLERAAKYLTWVGTALPVAYVLPIALFELPGYLSRLDLLGWMSDLAILLSLPWEVLAVGVILLRWRDLPQRFWIVFCVNAILAYMSLPIYRMHFGLYR